MQSTSMTSREFCYLVVTKDVFPQKQKLPNPSLMVKKIHCICLMTAIPTALQRSYQAMHYEGLRNHEISRISEQTSTRNICRAYNVPGMIEATFH